MDFKVAGTADGVTALQMDIKIDGHHRRDHEDRRWSRPRTAACTSSARWPRRIDQAARRSCREYAPRIITIKIHPDKIREVIGKGGSIIQAITEETGTQIDIAGRRHDQDRRGRRQGRRGRDGAHRADHVATSRSGRIYEGKVAKIMDFGAFVTIAPGQGRPGAHVADLQRARREGRGRGQGRPDRSRSRCWKSTSRAASACR